MDYARKIGKSKDPPVLLRRPTTILSLNDGLIRSDRKLTEDNRLVNWKRWLKRRDHQYRHIEAATGRHRHEQVLNSCETVREKVEMRNLIDYASVPVPVIPDKYRGGPEFFRTPQILHNRGDPCLPEIAFTPTKKELNIAPELSYVGLPELIEREKHLTGLKARVPLWKRSQYLMRRKQQLSREIKLLVPKEPEIRGLVIKNYVPPKIEYQPRIPPITVSDTEEQDEENPCRSSFPEQAVVLKIQDREIAWQRFPPKSERKEEPEESITWSLAFAGKVNKRSEKDIVFENKGNRVIIYQWRDGSVRCSVLTMNRRVSPFFFNKTKGVILPGQIVKLKVWYKPRSSSVSTEYWKLTTDPVICSSPLIFRFWGCAETIDPNEIRLSTLVVVDKYLDRCIRDRVVREILQELLENIGSIERPGPAYSSLFLESDVFISKNPLCYYNPSVLLELHKLHYNATNQNEERWNMSLDELRETLLNIKDRARRKELLQQFSGLYKECLKPTLYNPVRCDKREAVYSLLCSFFNAFESESELARCACLEEPRKAPLSVLFDEERSTMGSSRPEVLASSRSFRNKRGKKFSDSIPSAQFVDASTTTVESLPDGPPYKQALFIRIYELLGQTLVQVFATIESFNNLTESDK